MSTGSRARRGKGGWTLIELVIVMAIITVLAALATVGARNAVTLSREATLKEDLFRMRDAIDQYYADKGKYPSDLQALVTDQYMREVPVDPISQSRDSWQTIPAEPDPNNPSADPGIFNVKSRAEGISLQGQAYAEF
jgi:general secretion pathway protein G